MTVHCAKCEHTWEFPIVLPMLLTRTIDVIKGFTAIGCPACGAYGENVLCGASQTREKTSDCE